MTFGSSFRQRSSSSDITKQTVKLTNDSRHNGTVEANLQWNRRSSYQPRRNASPRRHQAPSSTAISSPKAQLAKTSTDRIPTKTPTYSMMYDRNISIAGA